MRQLSVEFFFLFFLRLFISALFVHISSIFLLSSSYLLCHVVSCRVLGKYYDRYLSAENVIFWYMVKITLNEWRISIIFFSFLLFLLLLLSNDSIDAFFLRESKKKSDRGEKKAIMSTWASGSVYLVNIISLMVSIIIFWSRTAVCSNSITPQDINTRYVYMLVADPESIGWKCLMKTIFIFQVVWFGLVRLCLMLLNYLSPLSLHWHDSSAFFPGSNLSMRFNTVELNEPFWMPKLYCFDFRRLIDFLSFFLFCRLCVLWCRYHRDNEKS